MKYLSVLMLMMGVSSVSQAGPLGIFGKRKCQPVCQKAVQYYTTPTQQTYTQPVPTVTYTQPVTQASYVTPTFATPVRSALSQCANGKCPLQ